MAVFDQRHRWGPVVRTGARITRTCEVCQRTDTAETLVPDAVFDALIDQFQRPNLYRMLMEVPR